MVTRRLDIDPDDGITESVKLDTEPHPQNAPPKPIELHVVSTGETIVVPVQSAVIIGRKDPFHRIQPDIDLTPYRGFQCGVSRSHAVIIIHDNELWIRALSSTNGTFVNSMPLAVGVEHAICDGDELKLGALRLRVKFAGAPASSRT